jgi:hypothetical protein
VENIHHRFFSSHFLTHMRARALSAGRTESNTPHPKPISTCAIKIPHNTKLNFSQKYLQVYLVFNRKKRSLPTFQRYSGVLVAIAENSPLLKSRNLCTTNTVVLYKMMAGFLVNSNVNEMISAVNLLNSQGTISLHLIVKTKISVQYIIRVAFNRHYFGLNPPDV